MRSEAPFARRSPRPRARRSSPRSSSASRAPRSTRSFPRSPRDAPSAAIERLLNLRVRISGHVLDMRVRDGRLSHSAFPLSTFPENFMSAFNRVTLSLIPLQIADCSSGGGGSLDDVKLNVKPDYIKGNVVATPYDGTTNDLRPAGIGKTGLAAAACPAPATPASPTVEELRKIAICNNYKALVDTTAAGGFGTLFGPNVDVNGNATTGEGKIAGEEHIAFADDGTGHENVTMMVQIPSTFTMANACIVTATSSGSRGIYGAIGTAGEWGLKHGCAVAYTDKGTGNGAHDLAANMVNDLRGTRTAAATAGTTSQFTAALSATDLAAYNTAFPNRWAFKHAHSQQNSEATWGRDTLRAIEFAFYMLNQKYGETHDGIVYQSDKLTSAKTIVIASSVSNGGGAAVAALEQDTNGLIDGIAVGEPQIFMNPPAGLTIKRGSTAVSSFGKTLYDYFTLATLYEPCAAISTAAAGANSAGLALAAGRPHPTIAAPPCAVLASKGLGSGSTTQAPADDA